MTVIQIPTPDLIEGSGETKIFANGIHIGTLSTNNGFVDYQDELSDRMWNLFQVDESGMVINDEPKLEN